MKVVEVSVVGVMIAALCVGCGKSEKPQPEPVQQTETKTEKWEPETAAEPTPQDAHAGHQHGPNCGHAHGPRFQEQCPVDGRQPRRDVFADADGQRVFLCSAACAEAFRKDPAKHISKLKEQGVTPFTVQATCPVNDKPIDRSVYEDISGFRIYFCSTGCGETFKRDPNKYAGKQMQAGVAFDLAPHAGHGHGPGGHNH